MEAEGYITPAQATAARAKPAKLAPESEDDRRLVRRLGAGRADRPSGQARARPGRLHHARPAGCRQAAEQALERDAGQGRRAQRGSTRRRWWCSTPAGRCAPWSAAATTATSPFNRAVSAHRQPGSAFKPFVYLAALEAGWQPGQHDRRPAGAASGSWQPVNFDGKFRGAITLAEAFAHSVNTAAVRLAQTVGPGAGRGDGAAAGHRLGACSRCRRSRSAPRR